MNSSESTVIVNNLPNLLSEEEEEILSQQITHPVALTEEWMIESFRVAKVFIQSIQN